MQSLTCETGHGHDTVLREWKVWRDKARIQRENIRVPVERKPPDPTPQQAGEPDDWKFARLAIEEARKTVAANDGRVHPKVGAVVVKDGRVLSTAHRGEVPENHAEYIALEKKLRDEVVAGATVYTTLEPCTTRNHPKIPCAKRLVERKVDRVVIGMLDPNPNIRGLGQLLLREANIETQLFPSDLMAQVEELNRDFIRAQKQNQPGPAGTGTRPPVEMTVTHQRLLCTPARHNYRLTVTLKNIGTSTIDTYHVDVLFPTGFLRTDVPYALELPSRRTATHGLFRVSTETAQVNALYPGDPNPAMTIDYYVERDIFMNRHEWLQENVTATLYVKGSPPLRVERPISEMQEF